MSISQLRSVVFERQEEPALIVPLDAHRWGRVKKIAGEYSGWAKQILKGSLNGLHGVAKSGLYKATRKGDVREALLWARLMQHFYNDARLQQHTRADLFEEARGISLLRSWEASACPSWEEQIKQLILLPKKWELFVRQGVLEIYLEAFVATQGEPLLVEEDLPGALVNADDLKSLFRVFWRVMRVRDRKNTSWLIEALRERALTQGGLARVWVEEDLWKANAFYGAKILIELLCGVWDASGDVVPDGTLSEEEVSLVEGDFIVPVCTDAIYDCHNSEGKRRLIRSWEDIAPGKPMPEGLDLRWSGMLSGVCWRAFAARQFPSDFAMRAWEDVVIPQEVWDWAMSCDRFFYALFYRKLTQAQQASPIVPIERPSLS